MPNERCIRALVAALLLTFVSLPGAYADPAASPQQGGTDEAAGSSPAPAQSAAGEDPDEGGTGASGPEPFVPSEKISADSAISFPVDI